MSARSIWKGDLAVGLVTVPVAAYKATDDAAETKKTWLHADCSTPINLHKVCTCCAAKENAPAAVHNLQMSDIVDGVKDADGTFVVLTKEDLASIKVPSSDAIAVETFVPVATIDPVYIATTYYLAPTLGKQKTIPAGFALLRDAMRASGVAMTGRVSLHGREHPVAIRPHGAILALDLLRTANEVRALATLPTAEAAEPTLAADQLALMQQLIGMYPGTFDPTAYEDTYATAFQALVTRKRTGTEPEPVAAPVAAAAPSDFMAALKLSLAAAPHAHPRNKRPAAPKPAKVAKPRRTKPAAAAMVVDAAAMADLPPAA